MCIKWAVVYIETGRVYQYFDDYNRALYCITDVFGPDGHKMQVVEVYNDLL